ncbi:hypothetical protein JWJ90_13480 [Desulfobulbus rhabdoformis]|uniref:hypothetical protein n=1 Tax=Desulfobulbus rhabdoformis TaxID=34032 RepID=UPI001965F1F1|nr:hypothetical protein [Desulfobulbus rhabdoformis]MBM9615290.1 hypothetical protein [Desulfobulbus rhabdoformis]
MNYLLLQLPAEFEEIVAKIRKQDWILSNFPATDEELYNPAQYVYNTELHGYKYIIVLDRNIFRFIISASKKENPNEKHRAAIALIYFCQASNIDFEPNLAVYEKLLPYRCNTRSAINDLIQFYKTDSAPSESLLKYALSESNVIDIFNETQWDTDKLHDDMTKYQFLNEWRSLYLIVLKIALFDHKYKKKVDKITYFMAWLVKYFRLSLPCIVFATILFSSKRIRNMNKLKKKSSNREKLKQLYNMTWDIFLVNQYFRLLTKEDNDNQFLVATDDKIVKLVLRYALSAQNAGGLSHLKSYLINSEHCLIDIIEQAIDNTKDRIYNTEYWTDSYRDELIELAENEVFSLN